MLKFGGIRDLFISHHDMQPLVAQHNLAGWMRHTAYECQFANYLLGAPWHLNTHKGIFSS